MRNHHCGLSLHIDRIVNYLGHSSRLLSSGLLYKYQAKPLQAKHLLITFTILFCVFVVVILFWNVAFNANEGFLLSCHFCIVFPLVLHSKPLEKRIFPISGFKEWLTRQVIRCEEVWDSKSRKNICVSVAFIVYFSATLFLIFELLTNYF